jgi:hypothetical protein
MYKLEFTSQDLEANRQGTLSEAQEQRRNADVDMLKKQGQQVIWFFAAFFVFAIVGGGFIEFNNAGRDLNKFLSPSNILGFKIAVVGLTCLMLFTLLSAWWNARSLAHAPLRAVEGKAHIVDQDISRGGHVYNIELRRGYFKKFTFRFQNAASLSHFVEGRHYRVYYLPHGIPQALSTEALDSGLE